MCAGPAGILTTRASGREWKSRALSTRIIKSAPRPDMVKNPMGRKTLCILVAGGLAAACGALSCAGLGNFFALVAGIHVGAGAAHSGKGPSDQELRSIVQTVTLVGAGVGVVLGGGVGALFGLLVAWWRGSDKQGSQRHSLWMWLLCGAVALVFLLPAALSLAWLLYEIPSSAPTPAPAGPAPTVPDLQRVPGNDRQ
jgi:hypothetical protein